MSTAAPPQAVTGLDRPIEFGPWPEVGGGQIWTQTAFPCFSYLVTLVGSRDDIGYKGDTRTVFALLNNPRHHVGMMVCDGPNGGRFATGPELQAMFHDLHFHCEGQLHDLILSHWYDALCQDPPDNG